jgi:hypothetical protein
MRLFKPSLADLLVLAYCPRQDEVQQYEAIYGRKWEADAVAHDLYGRPGVKFCLRDENDSPICAAGFDQISPGVWHDWMIGTQDGWDNHWMTITKAGRKIIDTLFEDGAVRIQTAAIESRALACKWYVKGLKMRYAGTVPGYAANGDNVVLYERLREGVISG